MHVMFHSVQREGYMGIIHSNVEDVFLVLHKQMDFRVMHSYQLAV